jgi:predicted porin
MNKKLITLAVAAAMAAPVAAMADATMYGKINLSIDYVDIDNFSNWFNPLPGDHSGLATVPAQAEYIDALQFGVVSPVDNTRISDPIPEYTTTYDASLMELTDRGIPLPMARVQATRDAIAAAQRAGSREQLVAAISAGQTAGQGSGYNGWDVTQYPGASRFGIKGSEDLGGGLKAIYQIELGIDVPEGDLSTTLRNSFVGLAGDWGTFLVGRHDTPYKISTGKLDLFSDTMADFNLTVGFDDRRASNAIAYISPSFSGFQFAGAAVAPGIDAEYLDIYNQTIKENNSDSLADAYSLAIIYKNGPFYGSVAYENFNSSLFNSENASYQALYGQTASDDSKWKVGLGLLDWNGFSLTGIYEGRSNVLGAPDNADSNLWQIEAGYAFGNNMVKAMYGQADVDGCADNANRGFRYTCTIGTDLVLENKNKSTWAIGFDHNFSKRTQVYALYTALDDDVENADWSGFSLGMAHSF